MKFTKYHRFGAYHWKQYDDNTKYRRHADRVKEWVKEKNVLDIGAGDGKITSLLGARGVDNEPEAVRVAKEKGVDVVLGDAYHLTYKDEEFDAVFMGDVLEHFEFPRRALREARRILRDYLYLATPEKGTNNDKFHYEEWLPSELKKLVESEGFKLEGNIIVVPKDKRIYGKFKKVPFTGPFVADDVIGDKASGEIKEIKVNTLDYIVKKYNLDIAKPLPIEIPNVIRDDLPGLFRELNFKIGVEIGVARGDFSVKICQANPQLTMFGVDSWMAYDNYHDAYSIRKLDTFYEQAQKQLAAFPNYKIIKKLSKDAAKDFADNSLDFVYIDANHKDPFVTEDITEWSKKVRSGGIVSGHDYFRGLKGGESTLDVIKATHRYTSKHNIKPWFVLGLKEKVPGLKRDTSRSWLWVKP